MVLCYLLNADWLFTSPEYRLQHFNNDSLPLSTGLIISLYIFYIQAFVYNIVSARLIYRCQKKAQNTLANFNPDIFRWLWTFLILTFLIWSLKVIADLTNIRSYSTWADVLIVIFIYSVAIAHWRSPKLFRVEMLEIASGKPLTDHAANKEAHHQSSQKDTPTGILDESTRQSLLAVTKEHMQQHKPYLDNQLTLNRLADAIGLSTHHLSEVLNQQEGKNFYQFVNQYRIDHILEQLNHDHSSKILDLALSAGFSSKSTFNAVFKQFTDKTPSQYRKALTS
ncbi:AraC family transcriptional regulator [Kangiella sp. HD9-110m-PIT-SAG07]|nr:AraC family transcriptional regulator [Kangiella sp. HD9-110m-PIT-SAG07]